MPRGKPDPVWLHPENPAFWDYQRDRVREMRALFDEDAKPQKVTVNLSWEARMVFEEAMSRAKEHTGTPHIPRALEHVCGDYLAHGPHARAMESIGIKHQVRKSSLETLMEQTGPRRVIETFNRVFPSRAILDFPK